MIFCIAVRLNRRTKKMTGAAGPQDMLWLESQNQAGTGLLSAQETALSRPEPSIDRIRWYRLPGLTYVTK